MDTSFFLGANSRQGFYSLYDELSAPGRGSMLYILKGGPGCGKSSFMRRIAEGLVSAGFDVERTLCSGDPDSLDAISIPALAASFADGTAPHVIEPRFPAVCECYVNLGQFYDSDGIREHGAEIEELFDTYRPLYSDAYRCIAGASAMTDGLYAPLFSEKARETVSRRVKGIAAREFSRSPGQGELRRRFLDAFTCKGPVRLYDTALSLCPKVFLLDNELGFAPFMVEKLCEAARSSGQDVILCPDPLCPERPLHLLVPSLGLCFISSSAETPFSGETYRHIRLDALADEAALKAARPEKRAMEKAASALLGRARRKLAQAKLIHDRLEGIYNPYVDFSGVYGLADRFLDDLLTKRA